MYRLFLVEDDPGIAEGIRCAAESWELDVVTAEDFRHVDAEFASAEPHIVLMDLMLPFYSGWHWCSELRKQSSVPIIVISSASDNMNIVMAMNMGADDFIAKPFDLDVLMAKIQALLRRSYDYANASPVLECSGAWLRTSDCTLVVGDSPVALTRNEYRILLLLMRNKGKVVSRERIMESLWETDTFVDENTLTVNVNRLRKKLEAAGLKDFIRTKFGVGYVVGGERDDG